MVTTREVNKQLKKTGYFFRFWMRREVRELSKVLDEDETIKQCVNGHYQGGLALLAATDRRLLLIDCKPMYLTLEVIWYDKIGQIDYNHRLMNATICVSTPNKDLNFTSYNTQHLRQALLYTQVKITEANKDKSKDEEPHPLNMTYHGQMVDEPAGPLVSVATTKTASPYTSAPAAEAPGQYARQQNHHLPMPSSNFQTSNTHLPFSRRRYFSPQESEPIA